MRDGVSTLTTATAKPKSNVPSPRLHVPGNERMTVPADAPASETMSTTDSPNLAWSQGAIGAAMRKHASGTDVRRLRIVGVSEVSLLIWLMTGAIEAVGARVVRVISASVRVIIAAECAYRPDRSAPFSGRNNRITSPVERSPRG
ncbi:hypothetical protein GCM10027427_35380 [Pseudoclavibacter terrae]